MSDNIQLSGTRFSSSLASSAGTASVLRGAVTGRRYYITDIGASSSTASAIVQLIAGGVNYWQERVGSSGPLAKQFSSPISFAAGTAVELRFTGGNASGEQGYANLAGYYI